MIGPSDKSHYQNFTPPFDIPESWQWVRLEELVEFQGGYAYKSNTYVDSSNWQVVRIGNVKNDKLLLDSQPVFVPEQIGNDTIRYQIQSDDILFTMTGTKGKRDYFYSVKRQLQTGEKFWYIDIDSVDNKQNIAYPKKIYTANAPSRASRYTQKGDVLFSMVRPYLRNIALVPQKDCIASTGFYVLHPSGVIDSMFSYLLALSAFFVDGLNSYMKGDNSPSIKKDNVENFVIPLPSLAEQRRIVAKVKELYTVLDEIEASLRS